MSRYVLFAVLFAALASSIASAQWIETVIHLSDSVSDVGGVCWIGYDSLHDAVYVSGYDGTAVFDGTTRRSIDWLPYYGEWVGSDELSGRVYICGESLYVLDGGTRSLLFVLPVSTSSWEALPPAVLCPAIHRIYITSRDSVAVVDTQGDSIIRFLATGESYGLCYAEPEGKVYSAGMHSLVSIGCSSDTVVGRIPMGSVSYEPLAYSPQSHKVYRGNQEDLSIVDCRADTIVRRISDSEGFWHLFHSPRNNRVYCAQGHDSIIAIDCVTDSVVVALPRFNRMVSKAHYCLTTDKYYAFTGPGRGWVVDCSRDTAREFRAGDVTFLSKSCHSSRNGDVYCAGREGGTVSVIDGTGDTTISTLFVSTNFGLVALWCNQSTDKVYVVDHNVGAMSIIEAGAGRLERTVPIGVGPDYLVHSAAALRSRLPSAVMAARRTV